MKEEDNILYVVNHHTLGVSLSNKFGSYGGKRDDTEEDNWGSVSLDEALTPFMNAMDGPRMILARTHSTQKIPIVNAEPALVETGAEYLASQLSSEKFIIKAKENGKVINVEDDNYMIVQYDSGKKEIFDIEKRYSANKRNTTIQITMENLKEGQTFSKNEPIAWS